jgi:cyclohexyl-isocyanide hydratase
MRVSFVIYTGMTSLDFIGIYDPITRLKGMGFMPDLAWDICAYTSEVRDHYGLGLIPTRVGEPLTGYDILIVPGGLGTRSLIHHPPFIDWIKTAATCPLKVSVCTGSLLLGAAGFLNGKPATTHPFAYDELEKLGVTVRRDRIVDAGEVITAGGVTAAIDAGLYLCERLVGQEAQQKIRRSMDYLGKA